MDEQEKAAESWGRSFTPDLLRRWPKDENGEPEPPVYLCHCEGRNMDEAMTVSRMEAYGIPCMRRYPGNGEFGKVILGVSGFGTDIFVPASLWEDACELLRQPDQEMEDMGDDLA